MIPLRSQVVHSFGSYRLGVTNSRSDLDLVCVAPQNIQLQEDFFGTLAAILVGHPNVAEFTVCLLLKRFMSLRTHTRATPLTT